MLWWENLKLRSKDPLVRLKAVEALGPGASDPKVLRVVADSLKDEDVQVRCAAAKILGTSKRPEAAEWLVPLLADISSQVRQATAESLGQLGNAKASIEPLKRLLRATNPQDRAYAGAALRVLGWSPGSEEETALFQVGTGNARGAAFHGEVAIEPLVSELKHDTSFARRSAAEALESSKDPRRIKPLIVAANDGDTTVRVSAIHALSTENGPEVVGRLLSTLGDPAACVRLAAAQVLARRHNPEFVPYFFELLRDSHFEIRLAVIQYLSHFTHPQITQAFVYLLADADSDVRLAAAQALAVAGDPVALEELVMALVDEERVIRLAAEGALNQIDPQWLCTEAAQRAATRLEASFSSAPGWVRSSISQLISKIRGTPENLPITT
jgi:HEAT repeat protein